MMKYDERAHGRNELNVKHSNNFRHQNDIMNMILKIAIDWLSVRKKPKSLFLTEI